MKHMDESALDLRRWRWSIWRSRAALGRSGEMDSACGDFTLLRIWG